MRYVYVKRGSGDWSYFANTMGSVSRGPRQVHTKVYLPVPYFGQSSQHGWMPVLEGAGKSAKKGRFSD